MCDFVRFFSLGVAVISRVHTSPGKIVNGFWAIQYAPAVFSAENIAVVPDSRRKQFTILRKRSPSAATQRESVQSPSPLRVKSDQLDNTANERICSV
jgi:hypothetical protein